MNIALRLTFQVPEFSKSGNLTGYRLEHVVKTNLVDEADFARVFNHDVEALIQCLDGRTGGAEAVSRRLRLDPAQAVLVRYRGVSVAHHAAGEVVAADSPAWT